jgi:hypothetical protein
VSRIERALHLLAELALARRSGDVSQIAIDIELDLLDALGGYQRGRYRNWDNRTYYMSRRQKRALKG